MPKVNPNILVWARESAKLSEEEAAAKLGLSGPARLQALESGEREPSRRQLANMAEKYRRPLLTFYLPKPPRDSDRGQDFRTLPEGSRPESEALLNALLRDLHARQGIVRSALEEADEDERLAFVGSTRIQDGVDKTAAAIQALLHFSAEQFYGQRSISAAFSALRTATENIGVFVLLMGNLGTHHTDIDVGVFRGFALSDDLAPFIVINEKDSRAAWSFTLLHELTHILLGQTGISGYDGEAEIEKFCDAVAARFLLNPNDLSFFRPTKALSIEVLVKMIGEFAAKRNLSRKMVAYNLLRNGYINGGRYRAVTAVFDADRITEKKTRPEGKNGPDYYVVRRHRMGAGLINCVKRMVDGGSLSTSKAGQVLGVKPTAVTRLVEGNKAA